MHIWTASTETANWKNRYNYFPKKKKNWCSKCWSNDRPVWNLELALFHPRAPYTWAQIRNNPRRGPTPPPSGGMAPFIGGAAERGQAPPGAGVSAGRGRPRPAVGGTTGSGTAPPPANGVTGWGPARPATGVVAWRGQPPPDAGGAARWGAAPLPAGVVAGRGEPPPVDGVVAGRGRPPPAAGGTAGWGPAPPSASGMASSTSSVAELQSTLAECAVSGMRLIRWRLPQSRSRDFFFFLPTPSDGVSEATRWAWTGWTGAWLGQAEPKRDPDAK